MKVQCSCHWQCLIYITKQTLKVHMPKCSEFHVLLDGIIHMEPLILSRNVTLHVELYNNYARTHQ